MRQALRTACCVQLADSICVSGGYSDDRDQDADTLLYTGSPLPLAE